MKKVLLGLGLLVLTLVGAVFAVMAPVFMGNRPLVDGEQLPGGATQVVDGFVAIDIIPIGEGQVALVDCGDDPSGAALLAALKAKNLTPDAVKAILLTHGHPDHMASCHLFPNADVYGFAGDSKLAGGEERGKGPGPSHMDVPKERWTKITKLLADGAAFALGTQTIKAFNVPGHTAGSAAYLVGGTLFLGDAAMARADGATLKGPPWVFSDDAPQARASLRALRARLNGDTVTTLAFSHTGPMQGVDALLGVD